MHVRLLLIQMNKQLSKPTIILDPCNVQYVNAYVRISHLQVLCEASKEFFPSTELRAWKSFPLNTTNENAFWLLAKSKNSFTSAVLKL